jgi:hypothetical protein
MSVNLMIRLGELGKISKGPTPVVSVYLDTRWADQHQRDRVRVFLKNELARAREASSNRAADSDLDWIESQGNALVGQATMPEGSGGALCLRACRTREHLSVRRRSRMCSSWPTRLCSGRWPFSWRPHPPRFSSSSTPRALDSGRSQPREWARSSC